MSGQAMTCTADIGTATTEVYVRGIKGGDISGYLYKGDKVIVTGYRCGWYRVKIGEHEYRVYGDYLKVTEGVCLDEVKLIGKVRKSRSAGKSVRNKSEHPIAGSAFDGLYLFD